MNEKNLVTIPPKKGEVRNPNGKPKGTKNTLTLIRDFMDGKIETLKGTKVSRFHYLLWSMYETAKRLQKQLDLYEKELEESAKWLIEIDPRTNDDNEKRILRIANKKRIQYEDMLQKVQAAHIKLSEFFLKSSGQYLEKKEIHNTGEVATIVSVTKEDLKEAVSEINNEL